jgi:hypothetical protein
MQQRDLGDKTGLVVQRRSGVQAAGQGLLGRWSKIPSKLSRTCAKLPLKLKLGSGCQGMLGHRAFDSVESRL